MKVSFDRKKEEETFNDERLLLRSYGKIPAKEIKKSHSALVQSKNVAFAEKRVVEELLVPAGEHVQDWLVDHGMSVKEFCMRMDMSRMSYNRIVNGKQAITAETASKLSRVTGIDAYYWMGLDAEYQMDKVRLAEQRRAEDEKTVCYRWIRCQPIADLVSRGLLPSDMDRRTPMDQEALLLKCYKVSSRHAYERLSQLASGAV